MARRLARLKAQLTPLAVGERAEAMARELRAVGIPAKPSRFAQGRRGLFLWLANPSEGIEAALQEKLAELRQRGFEDVPVVSIAFNFSTQEDRPHD
jgi:hypothetical protein